MILIDLQKVFSTINHEIILGELHAIGSSAETVAWFKSYLLDWTSRVNIDNYLPDLTKTLCVIPLKADIHELLCLLYVNDMFQAAQYDLFFYVHDSSLTHQRNNVETIEK